MRGPSPPLTWRAPTSTLTSAAVAALAVLLVGSPAAAEPANCQKQVVTQLLKRKKIEVKAAAKCLDAESWPRSPQRDVGDSGENDCQRAIGRAGIEHLLDVEKTLEGNDRATCLADLALQAKIDTAEVKLDTAIRNE